MELHTVSSAAQQLGCSVNRLKLWMDRGLFPDCRIQIGKVRARVIDSEQMAKLKMVIEAIDQDGVNVKVAFDRYYNEGRNE